MVIDTSKEGVFVTRWEKEHSDWSSVKSHDL